MCGTWICVAHACVMQLASYSFAYSLSWTQCWLWNCLAPTLSPSLTSSIFMPPASTQLSPLLYWKRLCFVHEYQGFQVEVSRGCCFFSSHHAFSEKSWDVFQGFLASFVADETPVDPTMHFDCNCLFFSVYLTTSPFSLKGCIFTSHVNLD